LFVIPKGNLRLQGRVPSVLFFTPTASGVTTGVVTPINSVTFELKEFVSQTFPDPSIAMLAG
jgi:hypothetical protein